MLKLLALKAVPVAIAVAALAVSVGGSPSTTAGRFSGHHAASTRILYSPYALSNWAGYIAVGKAAEFTSAAADWTVPSVTCLKKANLYAPWVGIDGDGSNTVEQTGLQTACNTGSPVYSAWYEMYPKAPVYFKNAVSVGDAISASVVYAAGSFKLTISDTTQGWSQTVTKKLASAELLSAEAVIEAPGGYPTITSVNFTNVLLDGKDLKTFHPEKSSSTSGTGIYHPTKITDGTNFSVVPKA
jgi:hypothetical protein